MGSAGRGARWGVVWDGIRMPSYFRSAATEEPAHAAAEQPQDPQESLEVEMLNWWGVDPLARTALKLLEESGDSGRFEAKSIVLHA